VRRPRFLAAAAGLLAAAAAPARGALPPPRDKLATRAERTEFRETSLHADVVALLDELDARNAPIFRGTLAVSPGGLAVPYVVASRPIVRTPAEARALQEPVVLVMAGADGGEVDGKEALLALLRDLCVSTDKTALDDLVLILVPLLNPDGNDRLGPQSENRPGQNGPTSVGAALNAAGTDLTADCVAAGAPETRGLLALLDRWEPDVFIDLQAAAGSFTIFSQLQAPPLHPAAAVSAAFARERLLPAVRADMREKAGVESFVWGHFGRSEPLRAPPPPGDVENFGWFTHDYRPHSAFNYAGLRGAIALMNAADAHDPFERRVSGTRAFLDSALSYCAKNDLLVMGNRKRFDAAEKGTSFVTIRAALPARAAASQAIPCEQLAISASPTADPGLPDGYKRTGTYQSAVVPVFDRYAAVKKAPRPQAYLIPYEYTAALAPLLRAHGIAFKQIVTLQNFVAARYVVRDVIHGPDGRTRLAGAWTAAEPFPARFGAITVDASHRLGTLVVVLLEPESDGGFFAWNVFDAALLPGAPAPVLRVTG
jgi:hypothetical protein